MGPAKILSDMTTGFLGMSFWVWVVFIYYVAATLLPIDKIIGRIYPVFGFALFFMAIGLVSVILIKNISIPELSLSNFRNMHGSPDKFPVFPMLFITVACGAISGFHSTQSPLMARCIKNEKYGRPVFYGAMITEGIVALIWAAIGMSFYGGVDELNEVMNSNKGNAALIVNEICNSLMGKVGGALALLGVVAAPITSGDTAFRGARLIVADFFKLKQALIKNRLIISVPLFAIGFFLTRIDFAVIWRYFAWSNQTLATIVLWAITIYLVNEKKFYHITLVPAIIMTAVISTYLLLAPEGFSLPKNISYPAGIIIAITCLAWFLYYKNSRLKSISRGNQ
jgi:carbon starvation protein CstA